MKRAAAWALMMAVAMTGAAKAVDTSSPGYREMERIIAVVNDDVVLLSEVEEQLGAAQAGLPASLKGPERQKRMDDMRSEVVESLIADRLLQQQVDQQGIEVTSEEVDRAIAEVQSANNLDEATFKQALAQQGMTMPAYREQLRKTLLKAKIINFKVRPKVSLTEKDIQSTVSRRLAHRKVDHKVKARHAVFLVEASATPEVDAKQKARADAFLEKVRGGGKFEELAKVDSDPPTQHGGDLGFFKRGDMMPEFEKAAFAAEPGQVVGPVKTRFGWHVIQVLERKSLDDRSAVQVEYDLREQLMAEELERAFKRYVGELRAKAHVEVRL